MDKARDEFKKIDRARQKIIKAKILILAKNPAALKNNIKRLGGGEESLYRLRIGAYRVIFKKDKARLIVLIVRVGHRREVYYELRSRNYGCCPRNYHPFGRRSSLKGG